MRSESTPASAPRLQWADATPRLRQFFAVWPDAAALTMTARAAAAAVRQAGGRATRTSNLHLTLAFVGEVSAEQSAQLHDIGAAAAAAATRCVLTLDRVGSFADSGIVWLGTAQPSPALAGLAAALGERLGAAGLHVERRPFRAHVTIARRCPRPVAEALADPIRWNVDALTLVTSELRPDGARYAIAQRWALGAQPAVPRP
jgi:2'-5' RNA ligase